MLLPIARANKISRSMHRHRVLIEDGDRYEKGAVAAPVYAVSRKMRGPSLLDRLREMLLDTIQLATDVDIEEAVQYAQRLSETIEAPLVDHAVLGPFLDPIAAESAMLRPLCIVTEPITGRRA